MAFALREGETLGRTTWCSANLATYAILLKTYGIVAGSGFLISIFRAIAVVIYIETTAGGHSEQGAQFGTAHTTEGYMGKAGKILIGVFVGSRPPVLILVVLVKVATHYIEWYYTHHSLRTNSSGVTNTIVCGADKGINIIYTPPGGEGECCFKNNVIGAWTNHHGEVASFYHFLHLGIDDREIVGLEGELNLTCLALRDENALELLKLHKGLGSRGNLIVQI